MKRSKIVFDSAKLLGFDQLGSGLGPERISAKVGIGGKPRIEPSPRG